DDCMTTRGREPDCCPLRGADSRGRHLDASCIPSPAAAWSGGPCHLREVLGPMWGAPVDGKWLFLHSRAIIRVGVCVCVCVCVFQPSYPSLPCQTVLGEKCEEKGERRGG